MPHFVIDYFKNIIKIKTPEEIMQNVYDTAESTELFDKVPIKKSYQKKSMKCLSS